MVTLICVIIIINSLSWVLHYWWKRLSRLSLWAYAPSAMNRSSSTCTHPSYSSYTMNRKENDFLTSLIKDWKMMKIGKPKSQKVLVKEGIQCNVLEWVRTTIILCVSPPKKHSKTCECCPGPYLIVSHYSSMSWFKFRNLSVIVTSVIKSQIH